MQELNPPKKNLPTHQDPTNIINKSRRINIKEIKEIKEIKKNNHNDSTTPVYNANAIHHALMVKERQEKKRNAMQV